MCVVYVCACVCVCRGGAGPSRTGTYFRAALGMDGIYKTPYMGGGGNIGFQFGLIG